jgi:hypothetical protein
MPQESASGNHRTRRSSLLNRSEVRKFILDAFRTTRSHLGITRVSGEALDVLEAWLRERTRKEVHSHPSMGKTFRI